MRWRSGSQHKMLSLLQKIAPNRQISLSPLEALTQFSKGVQLEFPHV